ncbi:HesB/YadR/YfhF family protein [Virgibacillus indicus]|nr:iron-sulfur cluster biosynthesis protein [Virgibacillus indicus]
MLRGGVTGLISVQTNMKIIVTEQANKWFEEELELEKGDAVRFYGKVYGKTEVHDNYSVAMQVAEPNDVLAKATVNGITYFAEKWDEWFFSEYDFKIEYDEKADEIRYRFLS